jgi:hypothetical protein
VALLPLSCLGSQTMACKQCNHQYNRHRKASVKLVDGIIAVVTRQYDHLCCSLWLVKESVVTSSSVAVIIGLSRSLCHHCHDCTVASAVVVGGLFS